jgi:cell division protease FtsH
MGHVKDYSEETAAKIDKLVLRIVNDAYNRAETMLKDNIDKLHQVADYLIKHEKMHNQDFEAVMNGTFVEPEEVSEEAEE